MKLLLDENLPKRLKTDFPTHEIYTVADKAWNGMRNGELLQLIIEDHFDALLTLTRIYNISKIFRNIQYRFSFYLPLTIPMQS